MLTGQYGQCRCNITLDMRSFIFSWNVPIQMQFYLLLPLIILSLRPQGPKGPLFRRRLALMCALAAVIATLYRIWVVITFNVQVSFSQPYAQEHYQNGLQIS